VKLKEFDYTLPAELIAQYPQERRDESRLLVIERRTSKIMHSNFKDIVDYFESADALVLNDTKVRPARIIGRVRDKDIDILLIERIVKNRYFIMAKPGRKLKPGMIISFANDKYQALCLESEFAREKGFRLIEFKTDIDIESILDDIGLMPLPPYIKRHVSRDDFERYQTVYAKNSGAIAAPTAGLHFTDGIFEKFEHKNVSQIYLTLHVGRGTFIPVKVDNIKEHQMHSEVYELSQQSVDKIKEVKVNGGRICAVGTTACRVLETCAKQGLKAQQGATDLFIYPGYEFKAVDMLLTNFHLPKTTLLMLVCAFAGKELAFKAYNEAVREKYRFFSYGDAMLII